MIAAILTVSILFQLVAVAQAIRLIRVTGGRWAWSLVALAIGLMALRRIVTGYRVLVHGEPIPSDLAAEVIALLVSVALVSGLALIAPLFQSIRQSQRQAESSRKRLQALVENEPECLKVLDCDGRLLEMNPAGLSMIEADDDASVLGKPVWPLVAPEHREAFRAMHQRVCAGARETMQFEIVGLRGGRRWMETHAVSFSPEGSDQPACLAVTRDITRVKQAQEEVARIQQSLEAAQTRARMGSWELDLDQSSGHWSREMFRIYGRDLAQGAPTWEEFLELIHPDDAERIRRTHSRDWKVGDVVDLDLRTHPSSGPIRHLNAIVCCEANEQGRPRLAGTVMDITERKNLEMLEQAQRRALESIAQGQPLADLLAMVVREIERLIDQSLASVLLLDAPSRRLRHGAAPSLPEEYCRAVDGLVIGENAGSCAAACHTARRVIAEDLRTDTRWADYHELAERFELRACWSEPILSHRGEVLGAFALYFRLPRAPTRRETGVLEVAARLAAIAIERDRAEQSLRESQERFARIASATNDALWDWDLKTNSAWWNEGIRRLFGHQLEDVDQEVTWWIDNIHPEDRARVVDDLNHFARGGQAGRWSCEYRFQRSDGTYADVLDRGHLVYDAQGNPVRMVGGMVDVTDRNRAQAAIVQAREELLDRQRREKELVDQQLAKIQDQLVRQTRLATIGQLAASIAHELRNPLGVIRNAVYFLKRKSADGDRKLCEYLDIIEGEAIDADRIISDLTALSRGQPPKKTRLDLAAAIRDVTLRLQMPSDFDLQIGFEPEPYYVQADAAQLRQVLRNILTNAIQAARPDTSGIVVRVEAREREGFDELTISDNGPGIPAESEKLIFEPLYSDKAKGTGLGLTICRQIVQAHGGSIDLICDESSARGCGATFRIRLPRATPSEALKTEPQTTTQETIRR